MGMLIVGILAMLAISWLFNLLAAALPELCLFVYRFSGSLLLLFGYVCWQTTDYSSGKGGVLFLQILLLSPFYMMFLAKQANRSAERDAAKKAKKQAAKQAKQQAAKDASNAASQAALTSAQPQATAPNAQLHTQPNTQQKADPTPVIAASKSPLRGVMLSQSTTFFPIGMLARNMAKLEAEEKQSHNEHV